ncbi:protein of unknown function [Candidatus Promineifilum breve]|uniref:DUF5615 domain-containing protein n=1 Tax=Candidatus Promineifilum breve TaxID=1806508 RepID=A0A160T2W5_9CHLR|nr:protein of unknown function [Candidatus Promineifilum breve]
MGNLGLTDEQQLAYSQALNMVLFTHDEDFLMVSVRMPLFAHAPTGLLPCLSTNTHLLTFTCDRSTM